MQQAFVVTNKLSVFLVTTNYTKIMTKEASLAASMAATTCHRVSSFRPWQEVTPDPPDLPSNEVATWGRAAAGKHGP